jgi:hypothetical protein
MDKTALLETLHRFIAQRPGLDPRNYISHHRDIEGIAAYRSDSRAITKDRHDAEALLAYIERRDSITAEDIIRASKNAFAGRLTIAPKGDGFEVDYCTGQYWPMEYRRATAAVAVSAIWERLREDLPKGPPMEAKTVRDAARRELGVALARRWFN